jgi:hypothetical protein
MMEELLGFYAHNIALAIAAFFALLAGTRLIGLYLRYHDRLSIDREDVQSFFRNATLAIFFAGAAIMFEHVSFFVTIGLLACCLIVLLLIKINKQVKKLEL